MTVVPGSSLGPYKIIAAVGAGGMGEVYKARDTRLDRTVAVKILPPHLCSDPVLRQRFEREARAISNLNHPQICTVHDLGQHNGVAFMVMEFLEGQTLAQRLQSGPLPFAELLRYAIQIADALDQAHRHGIVHRDLKPGNVMLTGKNAKLLDFGLAKSTPAIAPGSSLTMVPTLTSPITQAGTIVGTFQYMSPEQVEGKDVDARSDIFAFGAVLYEMVTGRRAFLGKSALSVASAVLEKDPEPISRVAPLTPPALDRIVRRCLAKDPEERWQCARDLLLDLKHVGEPDADGFSALAAPHHARWASGLLAVAAVVLLAAAATFAYLYYRNISQAQPVVRAAIVPPEKVAFHAVGGPNPGPAAVSPDGRKIVYSAQTTDGQQYLYVRSLESSISTQIPGTLAGSMPFWAPDNQRVGFFADSKLKQVDVTGGPALTICDTTPVPRGGAWNQHGDIIFASGPNHALMRVPETGGKPVVLTEVDREATNHSHRWPQFLPDGKHFFYFSRFGSPGTSDERNAIRVGSLDGGRGKEVLRTQSNAFYGGGQLLFLREQTLYAQAFDPESRAVSGSPIAIAEQIQFDPGSGLGAFSASQTQVLAYQTGKISIGSQLRWLQPDGKEVGTLADTAYHLDFSVSPDHKTVASSISVTGGPPDVWLYDVARRLRTRFTFDPGADRHPVWSHDGTRIVFASNRNGRTDLFMKSVAGAGGEETLLATAFDKVPTDWSTDGRFLIFNTTDSAALADVWVLPMTGERKPFPLLHSQFSEFEAKLSPDKQWLVYTSDESGRQEIYVTRFPNGGRKWQISNGGASRGRWSADGKRIYYLGIDDFIISTEVLGTADNFIVGGTNRHFQVRGMRPGTIFSVIKNGERFLLNSPVQSESSDPLTVMINWQSGLSRQ
jgi:eukaryotic-like serine/threonine-protein kinase